MRRILLPTDFSKNSLNAINYAMDFFKGKTCEFYFLNVQKPSEFVSSDIYTASPIDSTIYASIAQDNKKQLDALVGAYSKKYASESFTFEGIFDFDVFVDAIQQIIHSKNIELIIMGTNGATGADEVLFGSNTLKVIRNVQHPILVIPENYTFNGFASLLFTLKEEDDIHPEALSPIGDMIKGNKVSLQVLQLDTTKQMPHSPILSDFSEIKYHAIEAVPTPEAVSSFEQLFSVDMHAIFIKPKSFFERIFSGTDTPQLSYESRVPLLVLK
ncbi:MAG: universal stress protein [Flavobacteriaceae bacterium]